MLLLVHPQKTIVSSTTDSHPTSTSTDRVLVLPQRMDLSENVIVSDSTLTTTSMQSTHSSVHIDNNDSAINGNHIQKEYYHDSVYNRRASAAAVAGAAMSSYPDYSSLKTQFLHSHQHHHQLLPPPVTLSRSASSPASPLISNQKNDPSVLWDQHLALLERLGAGSRVGDSQLSLRPHSRFGSRFESRFGNPESDSSISKTTTTNNNNNNSNNSNNNNNNSNSYNHDHDQKLDQQLSTRRASLPVTSLSQATWGSRSLTRSRASSMRPYAPRPPRLFRGAFKKAMTVRSPVLTSTSSGMGTLSDMSPSTLQPVQTDDASSDASLTGALKLETRNNRQGVSANRNVSVLKGNGKEEEEATCHIPPLLSAVGSKMRSTSRVSSLEDTPSRSASMSLSPSASQSSQSFIQEHVTAHDISLMTASFGALTPQEIQSRFYAQREQEQRRQKSRRLSRRKTITKNMNGQQQQQQLLSAPNNANTAAVGLTRNFHQQMVRHQFQQFQRGGGGGGGGVEPSIHPFERSLHHHYHHHHHYGLSITGLLKGDKSPTGFELQDSGGERSARPLPSYYYLPPSAFRTVEDVAAEERREAEKRQQERDRELEEYLVFSSPVLS